MRLLTSTEMDILKKYGMLHTEEISNEEYEMLSSKAPHYILKGDNGKLMKFVISDEVTEETLINLNCSESIRLQHETNELLSFIKISTNSLRNMVLLLAIIVAAGAIAALGFSMGFIK